MKRISSSASLLFSLAVLTLTSPQPLAADPQSAKTSAGWLEPFVDPDGDCRLIAGAGKITLEVPGGKSAHDLAAEIGVVNAPRVLRKVTGDFVLTTKTDGDYAPGEASTLPGRTGYNGAGIIVITDDQNVICLARAVLQHRNSPPRPYANFEMRKEGALDQIGNAAHRPLPLEGPVWLRLTRKGTELQASVSSDGTTWEAAGSKEIPESWNHSLQVGITAISTSANDFAPVFSETVLEQ